MFAEAACRHCSENPLIPAVQIAGTTSGGRGSIIGGLVGAVILVVVVNAVLMIGLPIQFQMIIKGLVIIIAAAVYVRSAR